MVNATALNVPFDPPKRTFGSKDASSHDCHKEPVDKSTVEVDATRRSDPNVTYCTDVTGDVASVLLVRKTSTDYYSYLEDPRKTTTLYLETLLILESAPCSTRCTGHPSDTLREGVERTHMGTTMDIGGPIHNLNNWETHPTTSESPLKGTDKDETHCKAPNIHLESCPCSTGHAPL